MKHQTHLGGFLTAALEDIANGQTHNEIEIVYYAKLADMGELQRAQSVETQEQWELKIPQSDKNLGGGRCRVRSVVKGVNEVPEYTFTIKLFTDQANTVKESTLPATKDTFDAFAFLANNGMRKRRYRFPVDNVVFEVDVFQKDDGNDAEWVKIDIEINDVNQAIPPFPFALKEYIIQAFDNTPTEKAFIRQLFETQFLTTKRTVNPVTGDQTAAKAA